MKRLRGKDECGHFHFQGKRAKRAWRKGMKRMLGNVAGEMNAEALERFLALNEELRNAHEQA